MHEPSLKEIQKEYHGNFTSYLIGFLASIMFTATSFFLAASGLFTGNGVKYSLIGLAVLQAIAQVLFFLHLGKESKPKWDTLVFLFMILVLFIIVLGTLWIMFDLNERVMPGM